MPCLNVAITVSKVVQQQQKNIDFSNLHTIYSWVASYTEQKHIWCKIRGVKCLWSKYLLLYQTVFLEKSPKCVYKKNSASRFYKYSLILDKYFGHSVGNAFCHIAIFKALMVNKIRKRIFIELECTHRTQVHLKSFDVWPTVGHTSVCVSFYYYHLDSSGICSALTLPQTRSKVLLLSFHSLEFKYVSSQNSNLYPFSLLTAPSAPLHNLKRWLWYQECQSWLFYAPVSRCGHPQGFTATHTHTTQKLFIPPGIEM